MNTPSDVLRATFAHHVWPGHIQAASVGARSVGSEETSRS